MKEASQLTQPQRSALVAMIEMNYSGEIWNRAKNKYDEIRSSLFDSFARESAEKIQGTKDLIAGIQRLRAEIRNAQLILKHSNVDLEAAKEKLRAVGLLLLDDGNLSISNECPDDLEQSIVKRVNKELGTREQVLIVPFESARLKLLTVATSEEAEKIIEPLLNFEVKVK